MIAELQNNQEEQFQSNFFQQMDGQIQMDFENVEFEQNQIEFTNQLIQFDPSSELEQEELEFDHEEIQEMQLRFEENQQQQQVGYYSKEFDFQQQFSSQNLNNLNFLQNANQNHNIMMELQNIMDFNNNNMKQNNNDGLNEQQFKEIQSVNIKESNQTCSVCINNFQIDEVAKKLQCNHIFHENCIKPWLADHSQCPNCRKDIKNNNESSSKNSNNNNIQNQQNQENSE